MLKNYNGSKLFTETSFLCGYNFKIGSNKVLF